VRTVVLQSQSQRRLEGWQGLCCASVRRWAAARGFAYRLIGDELFERLPPRLRERHAAQIVVLSDLARLLWLQEVLDGGFQRAIWCDADLLVFRDFEPVLDESGACFGRECWIQRDGGKLRSYRKIHNAWMQFAAGSGTLAFYRERARVLLERAQGPVVPQFIGPKLLTAWHNIAAFAVEERVGMLSPLGMAELLGDDGPALKKLRLGHAQPLCALNLSASCAERELDGVLHRDEDYRRLVEGLLDGSLSEKLDPP
jgi:hypothetical protein